jgi:hypothetical protein
VPEVTVIDVPSCKYKDVVLSTTIKEAFPGTDMVEAIGYAVPLDGAEP